MSSHLQFTEQNPPPIPFLSNPFSFSFSFLSIFCIFLVIKWLLTPPTRGKNRPPSPPKLPIIGNFHQIGSLPHRSLQSLAAKHGPIMQLQLGSIRTVVVSSADAACEVMKTHDLVFADRHLSPTIKKLMYDGKDVSVAPYGEFWRQLKSVYVLQLLSRKKVESFHRVRAEEVALMLENIRRSSSNSSLPVNLSEMFVSLTNDVISRAAFGRKYGEGEGGEKLKRLLKEFLELLGRIHIGDWFLWLRWVGRINGVDAEVERVAKELDEILESVVQERMRLRKEIHGREDDSDGSEDFLDILLGIYTEESASISLDRDSIKSLISTTFAAGTDTTSTFLEWAMAELLRNHRVMKKLQTEVREVLKGTPEITNDDLEKMVYLKAVIKETLRCHPPIPLLVAREARENVKLMGYDIDAGTTVITNAWAIGRDPTLWDEPEEFRPERFENSDIDFKGFDFQLIPFGAGRRGCPGISFAMAVNELVLANLVHKFEWELPGEAKAEELDMAECPGVAIHRRNPLLAVATPWPC